MRDIFGSTGIIGGIELIIVTVFVLGFFIFRKTVANDMLDRGFSIIGSTVCGVLSFLILTNVMDSLKAAIGIGLIVGLLGGFLLAEIIQDGQGGTDE